MPNILNYFSEMLISLLLAVFFIYLEMFLALGSAISPSTLPYLAPIEMWCCAALRNLFCSAIIIEQIS